MIIIKNPGCDNCNETQVDGRCYIDSETGFLCVSLENDIKLPKGKKVLIPKICTTCGTTEWVTIDTEK